MLLVEAVVASFLMVLAFVAASMLFDAALRWESESGNVRRAALVAEKKMEELRALSADVPAGATFSAVLASLLGPQTEYPEAPGFAIDVARLPNTHRPVTTSGLTPDPGAHSPCSSFFTAVPDAASNPPDGNPQRNNAYATYPYTRHLPDSLALVQVTVTFAGGVRSYRLISLLGDPVTPFDNSPADNVRVSRISGPAALSDFTSTAEYSAQVITSSGSLPKDVTCLWSLDTQSTGSLVILPGDSSGRTVRVRRRDITALGTNAQARLVAKVRYGGQEAFGFSAPIALP
jgi:hypothetical protein